MNLGIKAGRHRSETSEIICGNSLFEICREINGAVDEFRENSELKKMVAELSLDNRMLKELNSKKW